MAPESSELSYEETREVLELSSGENEDKGKLDSLFFLSSSGTTMMMMI